MKKLYKLDITTVVYSHPEEHPESILEDVENTITHAIACSLGDFEEVNSEEDIPDGWDLRDCPVMFSNGKTDLDLKECFDKMQEELSLQDNLKERVALLETENAKLKTQLAAALSKKRKS